MYPTQQVVLISTAAQIACFASKQQKATRGFNRSRLAIWHADKTFGFARTCATIRNFTTGHLASIVGPDTGVRTCVPLDVERVFVAAWDPVYNPDVSGADDQLRIQQWFTRYFPHMLAADEYQLQWSLADALRAVVRSAKSTAGGLDGWTPKEWRLLDGSAIDLLAEYLISVENSGGRWHQGAHAVRAVCLEKSGVTADSPLSYRVLSIANLVNRAWAKARLRQLRPWTKA